MTSDSLKNNAKTSIIWSFIERIGAQGVGFLISIILSRLLQPSDYGTIALLSVFISIAQVIIDSGFSTALIQNQERNEVDYCTAFYCNIGISVFLYLLLYFGAPLLATLYNQEILTSVLRIYGITIIISSLAIVQKTRFIILYKFRIIAIISTLAIFISGIISIALAYNGLGVWSLVTYYLLTSIITTFGYWICSKWIPKASFSIQAFKKIFGFGSKILSANIINAVFSNLYTLVIGRIFSAVQLGYFNRSQSIANIIPSNFSNIMSQASYPVFCELQGDKNRLRDVFLKYVKLSFYICAPIMTLLIGIATPLVHLVLTDKWSNCIIFIQIMSFGYMFDPIMRLNANVMNVTGKSSYNLYSEVLKKLSLVIILLCTVSHGITALVGGLCAYSFADLLIGSMFVNKVINVSIIDEAKHIVPTMLCCIFMYCCIHYSLKITDNLYLQILIGIAVGGTSYFLASLLLAKREISCVLNILKSGFLHVR